MNILIVVESLRINETSSGIVSSTFIKSLSKQNDVTCVFNQNFSYSLNWLKDCKLIAIEKKSNKNYSFFKKIPKLMGLLTAVNGINLEAKEKIDLWKKAIENQLKANDFDLIITLASGSSFLPHYAMIKIKTDTPWLANFHDPYPMSVYPEPYKKKKNIFLIWQEFFTKKMIKKADYVSFPSLYLKNLMQEKYFFKDNKSIILPHVGMSLNNLPKSKIDDEVNLDSNKFNLMHAGTLLGPRKTESLFKAFQRFLSSSQEKKEVSILNVLGKVTKEHKKIKNTITKFPNNFNIITKRVSYKKSLELAREADIMLIIEAEAELSPFMPGKLADLIYLEKPILALTPKKSETIRILGDNYPYQARVNDEDEILKILNLLWNNWRSNTLKEINYKKSKKYISSESLSDNINKLIKC